MENDRCRFLFDPMNDAPREIRIEVPLPKGRASGNIPAAL
jgi:hypothetical protein